MDNYPVVTVHVSPDAKPETMEALGRVAEAAIKYLVNERTKPMRYLTDHKINPANDSIKIAVTDEPGPGGANHQYVAVFPNGATTQPIIFQNGPIGEVGVNGTTNEALIAIVIDRLRSFQSGDFKCRENALALTKLEEALHWLHARTLSRMARNVEGTNQV